MRGKQSRHLIDIRDQLRAGVNISHILYVKVTNEPENKDLANAIREEMKRRIWNVVHLEIVVHNGGNLPVSITWTINNVGDMSAYYYAINLPYIDEIVCKHTQQMLSVVCNEILAAQPEYGQDWGIAYLVTKPLAVLQAMVQEDLFPPPPVVGGIEAMAAAEEEEKEKEEE